MVGFMHTTPRSTVTIASAPCGAGDAFLHPTCARGLRHVELHTLTRAELAEQAIVYCDACGQPIVSKPRENGREVAAR